MGRFVVHDRRRSRPARRKAVAVIGVVVRIERLSEAPVAMLIAKSEAVAASLIRMGTTLYLLLDTNNGNLPLAKPSSRLNVGNFVRIAAP